MPTGSMGEVIRQLAGAGAQAETELTDAQLVDGFVARRDTAALAALVRRHGPMVWGVCRRILRDPHDAEDAFQATFLVFVRRVGSVTSRGRVANWLYGVAARTARKARATAARRRGRERQVPDAPEPEAPAAPDPSDLPARLDQELSRLPAKYRAAIVLCDLEGKTRQEAARELGCPPGTVAGWLSRGREMLARRLGRHGVVVPAGSLAAALAPDSAAGVPPALLAATVEAARQFAAGPTAAVTPEVTALTQGVLNSMILTKLKAAGVGLLAALLLGAGLSLAGPRQEAPAAGPPADKAGKTAAEGPPAGKKDAAPALDAVQGVWRVVEFDVAAGGLKATFEKLGVVVVARDKGVLLLDATGRGDEKDAIRWAEFTITRLDLKATPGEIDARADKIRMKDDLQPGDGTVVRGLVQLKDDTLKVYFGDDGRPKGFPDKAGQGVVTLRRVRPEKDDRKPADPPAPQADRNGFAVRGVAVKDGKVEFELAYGRNVTGIVRFVVEDGAGQRRWVVAGSGQNDIRRVTYGVVPFDRSFAGRQQEFPRENAAPADVRGQTVRLQVHYRVSTPLGPGVEIYEAALAIPRE
jgi:RNA polymerase sigma-70 factor (ECF subfamily)